MANQYLTPNMNLVVPVAGVQTGPNWAYNINVSLTVVDSHNHSPGNGIQITPSAININSDLPININNLTLIRSIRFASSSTLLSGPSDLGCLYESGVDLYYNDGNGTPIRITQSGAIVGSPGTITGLPSGTASASYSAPSGSFIFQQATTTAANLDVGSVAIRYPGSYPTPTGNYIQLQAPSSLSSGYSLTLPSLPAQTNVMTLNTSGVLSSITYDQVGQGMTSVGANAIANSRTRDFANNTAGGTGAVVISSNCGNIFTTSTMSSFQVLTNCSVTLTTTGRPVFLALVTGPANPALPTRIGVSVGTINFKFTNTTTSSDILLCEVDSLDQNFVSHPALPIAIDAGVNGNAGTYTWSVYYQTILGSGPFTGTAVLANLSLLAYEL